jgi:type I restriction enzyme R subunit
VSAPRHSEAAFETVIEAHLLQNGYVPVAREGFDRDRAIFPKTLLAFIRETQPKEWTELESLHGDMPGEQILGDLCKWMDRNSSLATVRHGSECFARAPHAAFVGVCADGFDSRGDLHARPGRQL